MNNIVAIERCTSYEPDEVYRAIKKTVEHAGSPDVKGKTLLLKPNIVFDADPKKAICTDPAVLIAAIRLFKEMGAKRILAGDSPGLQTPGFIAKLSGLGRAAMDNGAEWVDFTREKTEISCDYGKVMKKVSVTRAVKEADLIINLPKLKTHQLMCFTGAMKNLFGLIPSAAKSTFHVRYPSQRAFASMIVDLNLAIKPVFNIMDAVIGMEGPGPAAGTPRHIGLILASHNVLAMDIAASQIIAYPPLDIPVNKEAAARGIWLKDPEEINYPLLKPLDVRIPDFKKIPLKKSRSQLLYFILPKPIRKLLERSAPGPKINHGICTRCGDCGSICAPKLISLSSDKKHMIINYRNCIRCFCCHEICRFNAIDIVKKPSNDLP